MSAAGGGSIYLIKHAAPQVRPDIPAEQWTLSDRGIEEARRLAEAARGWGLRAVYSSMEPKATATALMVADAAGVGVNVVDGFEELRLGGWIANADEFNEAVRRILGQPERQMRGAEPAAAGVARFSPAMEAVRAGELPAAVVSHGRIMAAYLSLALGEADAFALWRSIPSAGAARIDAGGRRLRLAEGFRDAGRGTG